MAKSSEADNISDVEVPELKIGLEEMPSHQRYGNDVAHLVDFDGTVYDGDVGQLAAQHDESHIIGVENLDDFSTKVDERRNGREDISRGSEKANIIVEESDADLDEIERVLTESQNTEHIRGGFSDLLEHEDIYMRDSEIEIVTAGVNAAATDLLEDYDIGVTGADIKQNGEGYEADYCGRSEKPGRISDSMSNLDQFAPIAVGDSATDADFMDDSVRAGGQAIAIEEGAEPYASVIASEDSNYETVSVLHLIFDELYSTSSIESAEKRAEMFLGDKNYELAEVEPGRHWNAATLEALSAYERVRQSYESTA
ncbi:MAG: hypothetical protein ABEK16_02775 [Candidatus Nanohalobium sp.]